MKNRSRTWIILCVLLCVVCFLVIYRQKAVRETEDYELVDLLMSEDVLVEAMSLKMKTATAVSSSGEDSGI